MQLARVIGTVVATVRTPDLEGIRFLVIQPLDRHLAPVGSQLVAADAVHMAGRGELVYFVAAREAAQAMPEPFVPIDHAIVGIVDAVELLAGASTKDGPADSPTDGPYDGSHANRGPKASDRGVAGPRGGRP